MNRMPAIIVLLALSLSRAAAADGCPALLDVEARCLNQDEAVRLCEAYRGKVLLIVNTASKCGYTYQYDGLEAIYDRYRDRGLVVLGFPSNDFGGQEPGSEAEIADFCRLTYSIEFPMFEKTRVRSDHADPLYRALAAASGEWPAWNFHKYLIDRNGNLAGSYPSRVRPGSDELVAAIEKLL